MKRTIHKYVGKGVTAESLGDRIRRMVNTRIMEPMDGEQIFDDQPNAPTKSMEVNPLYDFNNDRFDLAEAMHISAAAISDEVESNTKSVGGQSETGGAEHSEQSEVNG